MGEVTRPMMLAYVRSLGGRLRADGSRRLAGRTVKNVADSVRSVFTDAVEEGVIASNPCAWNARKHLPAIVDASARAVLATGPPASFAGTILRRHREHLTGLVKALQDRAAGIPPEPEVPVVEVGLQSVGTGGFRQ